MTLQEAIRSGRPFRRKGWDWIRIAANADRFEFGDFGYADISRPGDILADDWEIQEPTITITASQLLEAFSRTLNWWQRESQPTFTRFDDGLQNPARFLEDLARRLGLEVAK